MYELLVQMMLMKHIPPHITDQNVNKVVAANVLFISLPNISGSMISHGPCKGCQSSFAFD